jgi:hypothetical protein
MRRLAAGFVFIAVAGAGAGIYLGKTSANRSSKSPIRPGRRTPVASSPLQPRRNVPSQGYSQASMFMPRWGDSATLQEVRDAYQGAGLRGIEFTDMMLQNPQIDDTTRTEVLFGKAAFYNFDGHPEQAYEVLSELRSFLETNPEQRRTSLTTVMFLQGLAGLRRGENENCILCRGESSCILPISPAARHINPEGSQLAIRHFTEYLAEYPDDLEVQWLLNLAHMTLGEYPDKVDPRYLVRIDRFLNSESDIGRFRDIGHRVGVNQFTQAGGAIMDDFDNDGLLDVAITSFDPTEPMRILKNTGRGTFEERIEAAGVEEQVGGGLNCVQTDFNNDGFLDVFVIRGAWLFTPVRPSLLRNDGNGRFTDVTEEAGVLKSVNSIAAQWADYDNDGWLDLFVCCEQQPSLLYHNEQNGTFIEASLAAGVAIATTCKGANWIDFDNDGYPDLFVNLNGGPEPAQLFRNRHDGTFEDVSLSLGIDGPFGGFSCWAWDYDNDGWQDIFSTCYDKSLKDVVQGLKGEPHRRGSNRLFHNEGGKRFLDVTKEAGLDLVFATMGSNFGDLDNDGFLDMYLGTGDPDLTTLVPNRMFRNLDGKRFTEITASAGTGNLQKGHGVAFGDWDRDGNVDVFIEMGGAIPGDKYHNILFQNPGHKNSWLTVKLIGEKTNRAAIGARIKVVTAGPQPRTIHRHVSSGSSFGANPLQQTIGLGNAERVETLEITWPTSGTTQTFRDVAVNQALEITEFAESFRSLDWTPIALPPEN